VSPLLFVSVHPDPTPTVGFLPITSPRRCPTSSLTPLVFLPATLLLKTLCQGRSPCPFLSAGLLPNGKFHHPLPIVKSALRNRRGGGQNFFFVFFFLLVFVPFRTVNLFPLMNFHQCPSTPFFQFRPAPVGLVFEPQPSFCFSAPVLPPLHGRFW